MNFEIGKSTDSKLFCSQSKVLEDSGSVDLVKRLKKLRQDTISNNGHPNGAISHEDLFGFNSEKDELAAIAIFSGSSSKKVKDVVYGIPDTYMVSDGVVYIMYSVSYSVFLTNSIEFISLGVVPDNCYSPNSVKISKKIVKIENDMMEKTGIDPYIKESYISSSIEKYYKLIALYQSVLNFDFSKSVDARPGYERPGPRYASVTAAPTDMMHLLTKRLSDLSDVRTGSPGRSVDARPGYERPGPRYASVTAAPTDMMHLLTKRLSDLSDIRTGSPGRSVDARPGYERPGPRYASVTAAPTDMMHLLTKRLSDLSDIRTGSLGRSVDARPGYERPGPRYASVTAVPTDMCIF